MKQKNIDRIDKLCIRTENFIARLFKCVDWRTSSSQSWPQSDKHAISRLLLPISHPFAFGSLSATSAIQCTSVISGRMQRACRSQSNKGIYTRNALAAISISFAHSIVVAIAIHNSVWYGTVIVIWSAWLNEDASVAGSFSTSTYLWWCCICMIWAWTEEHYAQRELHTYWYRHTLHSLYTNMEKIKKNGNSSQSTKCA